MARRAWRAAACALAVVIGGSAGPASAKTVDGECTGSIAFQKGTDAGGPFSIDVSGESGDVYVVPLADEVLWEATTPARSGSYSGFVEVALPFPFGALRIEEWTGEVQKGSNSGLSSYDLPSGIPPGVEFVLRAEHQDSEGLCVGTLRLKLEGQPFSKWYAWGALGVALLMFLGFMATAGVLRRGPRQKKRSVGRGLLAAVVGAVFGALLGVALMLMGVAAVDSPLPFGLGLVLAVLGALLGGGVIGASKGES
ncbi:MAG: hypothetical protein ACO3S5_09960 [Ilumatobacteraceae bacterium]